MFYPGVKIVIVESSVKKKTLGIKHGSLGNISTAFEPIFIRGLNVVASVCTAYFTRYGFEKPKGRLEKKQFINIFPIITQQKITTGKINRQIESIFKSGMKDIHQDCGVDYSLPIVIACPIINCGINMIEDHGEFTSWFHSVMTSNIVHYASVIDPLSAYHRRYFDLNDEDFSQFMRDLVNSKVNRTECANSLIGNDHGRKTRFIRRLMSIISIYSKTTAKSMVLHTTNHVNGKRKLNEETLCVNLAVMFFNGSIKTLLNISTKDVNKTIIKNTITTGNHLRGLSHRTLGLVGDGQETKED
ncbi:hypothetical protein DRN34_00340 [Thermococci archaeon]|nr:MAG: hypothetical protein DRN34_00340 [Thermococci archaeon]